MKMRPWLKKISGYVNTPVAVIASVSILAITTTSFLPINLTTRHQERRISSQESSALQDDQYGKIIEVQNEYGSEPSVSIPTEAPSMTDIEPDDSGNLAQAPEIVTGTIISELLRSKNQKGHPVVMPVQRQLDQNKWQDALTIDVKEAALTTDMLRRDTGTMASLSMPPVSITPKVAELNIAVTPRAIDLFNASKVEMNIDAQIIKVVLPTSPLPLSDQDMQIQLRRDLSVKAPEGAIGDPVELTTSFSQPTNILVVLPIENKSLTNADIQKMKIHAQYEDGTVHYIEGKLTGYNTKLKGIEFVTQHSGSYTLVEMKKTPAK